VVAISAAISPYREVRDEVRAGHERFFEVFVKCPLDALIERDVKGLYKKALKGEIKSFTGVSDPYEEPLNPELVVESDRESVEQSLAKLLRALESRKLIHPEGGLRNWCEDAIVLLRGGEPRQAGLQLREQAMECPRCNLLAPSQPPSLLASSTTCVRLSPKR
jgi:Adenylylsulphate kinase